MKKRNIVLTALVLALAAATLGAATIYPINQAEMLAGAKFDFKVEFDSVVTSYSVKINGLNYNRVLGANGELITETLPDGSKASALILRDATIAAGEYTVTAKAGDDYKTVSWSVYPAAEEAQAKSLIVLIADGMSVAHRTAARIMEKGNVEGTSQGILNIDKMERLGMMGTSSVDAITVDSANSMSAYMTGHKSSINAIGVYADRTSDPFDDPKQENIAELLRRTSGKSIGIVSDAELEDATPAAVVAHTRKRAEKAAIVGAFYEVQPEVILGGGSAYFIPQEVTGSKRDDSINYVELFADAGYEVISSATELEALQDNLPDKLLGLFHTGNMDGALDRLILGSNTVSKFPDQPDLTRMAETALDILSKNEEGFFLMVEAASVDKFTHPMDWERAVYDFLMFDQVIGIMQAYCDEHPDTLLVVTGDHTHSVSVYGTVDDEKPVVNSIRDKLGTYADAGFVYYEDADGDGYPDDPYPSKRLAFSFGNHPSYYETFGTYPEGTFTPAVQDENGLYVANEAYNVEGALYMEGNLPYSESQEVHAVDDQILSMSGPGADQVKAYQENTKVFKYIVKALGINPEA